MKTKIFALSLFVFGLLVSAPAGATITKIYSPDELVAEANLIVVGTVGPQKTYRGSRNMLRTVSDVSIAEVWKGNAAVGDTVKVRQLGGFDGEAFHKVSGDILLEAGQEVVLFLRIVDGEPEHRFLVGMAQGRWLIDRSSGSALVSRRPAGETSPLSGNKAKGTIALDVMRRTVGRIIRGESQP